jgi:hypothetical protein
VNTREAGILRPSGRTEKRAGAAPDDPLFIGRAPKPDQTIDLKARPHLTIGPRNRSGLLRRKTTLYRALDAGCTRKGNVCQDACCLSVR